MIISYIDVTESPVVETPGDGDGENSFNNGPREPSSSDPKAKRRRVNAVPEWEGARPQWEQGLGDSQVRQQMNDIVQRPWATVNHPAPVPIVQSVKNGTNGARPVSGSAIDHPSSTGWATVNQPAAISAPQPFNTGADGYKSNLDQGRREETVVNEEGSVALIDTLPKNKQRQVYGLVSGLQGGIEHLQKELDSLKRALGIDEED